MFRMRRRACCIRFRWRAIFYPCFSSFHGVIFSIKSIDNDFYLISAFSLFVCYLFDDYQVLSFTSFFIGIGAAVIPLIVSSVSNDEIRNRSVFIERSGRGRIRLLLMAFFPDALRCAMVGAILIDTFIQRLHVNNQKNYTHHAKAMNPRKGNESQAAQWVYDALCHRRNGRRLACNAGLFRLWLALCFDPLRGGCLGGAVPIGQRT